MREMRTFSVDVFHSMGNLESSQGFFLRVLGSLSTKISGPFSILILRTRLRWSLWGVWPMARL